jgi:hypothetical protein
MAEVTMTSLIEKIEDKIRYRGHEGVAGIWTDEHQLVKAAAEVKKGGFDKIEAISPYPIHGIDDALDIPRSYIPWITFTFGSLGGLFGLWFTWWTSAVDWPLIIGGKPMWSLAAFIPVIFECTILFAALSSVIGMIIINGLPKVDPPVIDPALSSHKFALFIPATAKGYDAAKLESLFKELGAAETKRTVF